MTFLKVLHPPNLQTPNPPPHASCHKLRLSPNSSPSVPGVSAFSCERRNLIIAQRSAVKHWTVTWQHGNRSVLLPDTAQWAVRNAIQTEHSTGFECAWNLVLWCLNVLQQSQRRSGDLKSYTECTNVHVSIVWNFAALPRINLSFFNDVVSTAYYIIL